MNLLRKTAGIILTLIIALSVIAVPTAVFAAEEAVETKNLILNRFGGYTYTIDKEAGYWYGYSVKDNNNNAITVDIDDWPGYYENNWVYIAATKETGNVKPQVEIYKESKVTGEKTTIANFIVKVKKFKKIDFGTVKISKGKNKEVLVQKCNTNWAYSYAVLNTGNAYKLKIKNKKIASCRYIWANEYNKNDTLFNFTGKKKGTTTADVYINDTKVKVGTIKIKVGNYKAKLDPRCKTKKDKYSKYGSLQHYTLSGDDYVLNRKSNAVYSFKAADTNVVSLKRVSKNSKDYKVIPKKVGSTKIYVYEKVKNKKKTKLGTINYIVEPATMAEVFSFNALYYPLYDDEDRIDIFEGASLNLSNGEKSIDFIKDMNELVMNHKEKEAHFTSGDYTVTFENTDSEVVSVDENGIVSSNVTYDELMTMRKYDPKNYDYYYMDLGYTIKFTDGSSFYGIYSVCIN